ncbi:hypothetical protein PHJA_002811400 [Phtheirospermum japonicum]|uniref:Transposase n=1 Tax=Phtheirospermum japonicum TaxID=374723 RepID=A0A830DFE8_9LAMI|nr:hypothetical protein PHJA_002811400 [Phtheirospermum japonicum]
MVMAAAAECRRRSFFGKSSVFESLGASGICTRFISPQLSLEFNGRVVPIEEENIADSILLSAEKKLLSFSLFLPSFKFLDPHTKPSPSQIIPLPSTVCYKKEMTRRRARGSSASLLQDIDFLAIDHNLPRCWVVGRIQPRLMPNNVSRTITKIFKKDIHIDGVNWKAVPADHKKMYFQKFKDHFSWAPSVGPAVCNAFMKQAALRYRDMITRFKYAPGNKRPKCVSPAIWDKWLAYWSLPEVIAKSEKARKNRKSEKAGPGTGCSRHSGGSRSARAHALALEKEKGRAPDAYECSMRIHKRKDGTFVDERARLISASVEEHARAAREVGGDDAIDMTQIYREVVAVERQRFFGTGGFAEAFVDLNSIARPAPVDEEALRRQVGRELQPQFTQQLAEQAARHQEQLDAQRRDMERRMQMMQTQLMDRRRGLLPPPGPDA